MIWRNFFLVVLCLSPYLLHAAKPGGVNGVKMWLRSDKGVTLTPDILWEDQSATGANDARQNNDAYKPTYVSVAGNFNPAFYFTNHFLDAAYASELNGADLTVLTVVLSDGSSGWRSPWTTRDDPAGNQSMGHILYLRSDNNRYDYWNGSPSSWKQLHTNIVPSGNHEIITTTSDDVMFGMRIDKKVYIQGIEKGSSDNIDFSANTNRPFRIGKGATESANGYYPWHGYISETIVFDKTLTDAQRNRVESYLAIKYGTTLDQSSGGQDYHDSNGGNAIWSVSDNSGYGHDIAGLARDVGSNGSDLDQRISHSINDDAVIVMSTNMDFNSENLDSSRPQLKNSGRTFLIWSNNDAGHGWTNTGAPPDSMILERKWKIQRQGSNQHSLNIQVNTDDLGFDIDAFDGNLFFVHGSDLSAATPIPMMNDGAGRWHVEDITFANHEMFSFVYLPPIQNAEMVINEVLFYQQTNNSLDNEEFIEFYVTSDGTLKKMLISDQENHQYTFPDYNVSSGEYVVLYMGGGTDSHSGGVHTYYRNSTQTPLNNNNDDIVLLRPSNTETTQLDGDTISYVPVDYIAYKRTNSGTNRIQGIPPTTQSPTIQWSGTIDASGVARLQSTSLTPNGQDTDNANDWENTTTGTALGPVTVDSNTGSVGSRAFICSDGANNNNTLPNMTITKTSIVTDDPVNGSTHPKRIPGATIRYCFTVDNTGDGDAEDVTVSDSLTGSGKDNLTYIQSGSVIQDIATVCNCSGLSTTNGTISGSDVTIVIGDINGTHDTAHSRGCAYIQTTIE